MSYRPARASRRVWLRLLTAISLAVGILTLVVPAASASTYGPYTGSVISAGKNTSTQPMKVTTPGYETVSLDWDNTSAALQLGIKDPSGTAVKWVTGHKPETVTWNFATAGTWTLVVVAKSGGVSNYTITVTDASPPPSCTATYCGTVDSTGQTAKTTSNQTYAVSAPGYETVSLDWDNASAAVQLGIKNPSGTAVKWVTGHKPETVTWDFDTTGNWTFSVVGKSGGVANYTITVTAASAPPTCSATFCGHVDANGTKSKNYPLTVSTTGQLSVVLNYSDSTAQLNLGLKDPSGNWVKWNSSADDPKAITWQVSTPGKWTVGVVAKSGASDYTITVTQPSGAPGGTIKGTVWDDTNGNGVRDSGEGGVPAATVQLRDSSGSVVSTTASGADGSYSFAPAAGSYRVMVLLPTGYSYGPAGQGSDSTADSDIDPTTAMGPVQNLTSGQTLTFDSAAEPTGDQTITGAVDSSGTATDTSLIAVRSAGTLKVSATWGENASANLGLTLTDPNGNHVATLAPGSQPAALTASVSVLGNYVLTVTAGSGAARYVADVSGAALQGAVAPVWQRQVGGSARAQMYPSGLDVDSAGNVYVADTGNDGVQAYSSTGTLLWKALARGRGNGQFSEPRDVAYYNGKVYVADTGNNRVEVLDASTGAWVATWPTHYGAIMGITAGTDGSGNPVILATDGQVSVDKVYVLDPSDGSVIRIVGSGYGTGAGQMNEPRDAATDAAGDIYVADFRNQRIVEFAPDGTYLGAFSSLGSGPGQVNGPYGIAIDQSGNIWVADANNSRLEEFDSAGNYEQSIGSSGTGSGQFFQLRRVAVGPGGTVYGADLWLDRIDAFDTSNGDVTQEWGGVPPPDGGFNKPFGVAVASDGTDYVADTTNQRVEVFDPQGNYLRKWGTRGFGDTNEGFNWPHALTLDDATGTVWVADTKNNRLEEFDQQGNPTGHIIGSLGTGNLQFHWPWGITASGGDLLVADTWNNRIMDIYPGSANGGELTRWVDTGFAYPRALTVAGGVLYVADSNNKRIVEIRVSDGAIIGTITNSQLHDPEGIAVTPSGDIWVSDTSWNRLLDFAPDGTLRQIFGKAGSGNNQFQSPQTLSIQRQGSSAYLSVVDAFNDRISVFSVE